MAAMRREQTVMASQLVLRQVGHTAIRAHPIQVDNRFHLLIKVTGPQASRRSASLVRCRMIPWLATPVRFQEAYHLVRTANPTALRVQPNARMSYLMITGEGDVVSTGSPRSDAERWESSQGLTQQSFCAALVKE